jgi:hypothetical protein
VEQLAPFQPVAQIHVFGAEHVPPFAQPDEQTAKNISISIHFVFLIYEY